MKPHPARAAMARSTTRFHINHSGRRGYKSEIEKRTLVLALQDDMRRWANPERWGQRKPWGAARYAYAGPTRPQTKEIAWVDFKKLIPKEWLAERPRETELKFTTLSGAILQLFGLDRPERIEGVGWDGIVIDEYGNCRPDVWGEHIRPALSDREGWAHFIGVPEGRNHYYKLMLFALAHPELWSVHHWHSDTVLTAEEIAQVKAELDELTYNQEYAGDFVSWQGRAYYAFDMETHCRPCAYEPGRTLIFCFDFNINPGVAAVCQETAAGTEVIGEVWIPRNSNTELVCRRLLTDWGEHTGAVECYGDATGGAGGSAKVSGSDWDLVRTTLRPHFGSRITFMVPRSNPRERARINSLNSRLQSADSSIRLFVDGVKAAHVAADLDGVALLEGGSGEIDKEHGDKTLTHICFPAGTDIAIPGGWKAIEDIEPGDKIITHLGVGSALTGGEKKDGKSELLHLYDSNSGVYCTPGHPFLCGSTWLAAEQTQGYRAWRLTADPLSSSQQQSRIEADISAWEKRDIMNQLTKMTAEHYIRWFGKTLTDQYPQDCISTIATGTKEITDSVILSLFQLKNINWPGILTLWLERVKRLSGGMGLPKATNGTNNMGKRFLTAWNYARSYVPSVDEAMKPNVIEKVFNFVVAHVRPRHVELAVLMMLTGFARAVARLSESIAIARRQLAPVNADESTPLNFNASGEMADVYNLKTSDGTFYANGFLVSNSDALGYYVYYRFPVDDIKLSPTGPVIIGGNIGALR